MCPVPGPRTAGTTAPSAPRVYNCLLGGTDNSAADRALAAELADPARGYPGVRELAEDNRKFILAAVTRLASDGIRQFVDAGCGLPPGTMVHEAAGPGARVAYVDHHPVVVSHMGARLHGHGGGLAVIRGDAGNPEAVLADVQLRDIIDLCEPVAVLLGGTLSAMTAGAARKAVAGFTALLAAGSCVAVSCASYADRETGRRMQRAYRVAGEWWNHPPQDIRSFFAGLAMPYGPVTDAGSWPMLRDCGGKAALVLAGVGLKQ